MYNTPQSWQKMTNNVGLTFGVGDTTPHFTISFEQHGNSKCHPTLIRQNSGWGMPHICIEHGMYSFNRWMTQVAP